MISISTGGPYNQVDIDTGQALGDADDGLAIPHLSGHYRQIPVAINRRVWPIGDDGNDPVGRNVHYRPAIAVGIGRHGEIEATEHVFSIGEVRDDDRRSRLGPMDECAQRHSDMNMIVMVGGSVRPYLAPCLPEASVRSGIDELGTPGSDPFQSLVDGQENI